MRMMLPFLIALRFDCGPAAEWQHFGAVVLAVPRMPETLRTSNARHARMPASPLLVGGACGRACAFARAEAVLLSEVPARRNIP